MAATGALVANGMDARIGNGGSGGCGVTRSSTGPLGTDKRFPGQRLDGSGLYFYNAR